MFTGFYIFPGNRLIQSCIQYISTLLRKGSLPCCFRGVNIYVVNQVGRRCIRAIAASYQKINVNSGRSTFNIYFNILDNRRSRSR